MKTKTELVNSWLDKANKDLLAAQHELTFPDAVSESICFHCQQAAEKYLKAYMIFLEIPFTKTHEIGELITKIETQDREIAALKEGADALTDYAVDVRYPEELFDPSMIDASEAYEIAAKLKQHVQQRIKLK